MSRGRWIFALSIMLACCVQPRGAKVARPGAVGAPARSARIRPPPRPARFLPRSTSTTTCSFTDGTAVTLSATRGQVNKKVFAPIRDGRIIALPDDRHPQKIPALTALLGPPPRGGCPEGGEARRLVIRADGRLPYITLYRVMVTAAMAGRPDFCLEIDHDGKTRAIETSVPTACRPRCGCLRLRPIKKGTASGARPPLASSATDRVVINVRLVRDGSIKIFASSGQLTAAMLAALDTTLPPRRGQHDFQRLRAEAERIHGSYPASNTAIFVPEPEISYQALVWAMDAVRDRGPTATGRRGLFPCAVVSALVE